MKTGRDGHFGGIASSLKRNKQSDGGIRTGEDVGIWTDVVVRVDSIVEGCDIVTLCVVECVVGDVFVVGHDVEGGAVGVVDG